MPYKYAKPNCKITENLKPPPFNPNNPLFKNTNKFYYIWDLEDRHFINNNIKCINEYLEISHDSQIKILRFGMNSDDDDDITEDFLSYTATYIEACNKTKISLDLKPNWKEIPDSILSEYEIFPELPSTILVCDNCDTFYDGDGKDNKCRYLFTLCQDEGDEDDKAEDTLKCPACGYNLSEFC